MKRSASTIIRFLFLAVMALTSAASAQNDIEDPNVFEGVWYRVALDQDGAFVLGDGDGYAGGTWYYYPQADGSGWWRHWFYNGPYDPNRTGLLDYSVYIKALDASRTTKLEVRFNWTTPEWSALGKQRPPLPSDAATPELDAQYTQNRLLYDVDNWFIGTVEPVRRHTIWGYSPEWVSVDVRGRNAYVYRGASHTSLPKDPFMGACYDATTGDCYTGYEHQCRAPYIWQGADSSCSEVVAAGPFPVPVYRFWSPALSRHFFTASEREKDGFLAESEETISFEGIAYLACVDDTDPNALAVHRFWSNALGVYFYTILEEEKEALLIEHGYVWTYDGPAFYVYPEGNAPEGTVPVYRLWSVDSDYHLYTISEEEKDELIGEHPKAWIDEGIAWYAYEP
ncbi:MAG: hypothetical protein JSW27_20655 [Phycisphaerales bacterium]|nr:MAG: hypothetical protein JSW27_20655 [Phycisphaerales bacterium]